jgi:hypothetical protein
MRMLMAAILAGVFLTPSVGLAQDGPVIDIRPGQRGKTYRAAV